VTKRRSTPRRNNSPQFEYWREISGIALLALAAVTILSLLPTERGSVTEGWLSFLWFVFGWGVYLIPFLLAAGGLALIIAAMRQNKEPKPVKLLAALTLYIAILAFVSLLLPPKSEVGVSLTSSDVGGGGYVGALASLLLQGSFGRYGAYLAVLLLLIIGLCVLIEVSPVQAAAALVTAWQSVKDWYRIRFTLQAKNGLSGHRSEPAAIPPPQVMPPPPTASRSAPAAVSSAPVVSTLSSPVGASVPAVAPGKVTLVPRIIGSAQAWQLPAMENILESSTEREISQAEIRTRVKIIEDTLGSFGVPARVIEVNQGPAVTQFGLEPGFVEQKLSSGRIKRSKVKVSKISGLSNDLALALAASPIRIEAPVPGRSIVGIEVPNMETSMVSLRSVMETEPFRKMSSSLKIALGQDVSGQAAAADLATMPHLLIAGATGSGKSVCINAVVACLLCQNTPDDLRFIMVDPKMVELSSYNGIPHLLEQVVVKVERVVEVLNWTTKEMDRRYELFSKVRARNLEAYNAGTSGRGEATLPKIVVIIDELADLMMVAPEQVERSICRIAQMARATGIHLVIATQRPSVDVITGLIKANFPARIAFAVTSQVDSRVILDVAGAERLLGRGDMLFMAPDTSKLVRLQGCFVSDREIDKLVRYWKNFRSMGTVDDSEAEPQTPVQPPLWDDLIAREKEATAADDLLDLAIEVVQQHERASASLLQRKLRIGYSRAARLIDLLEEQGIIGPDPGGGRSREVLVKAGAPPPATSAEDDEPPF
jgi:DNA segregation ATPase FtsK/SpoIIIE, S-DNA-T family